MSGVPCQGCKACCIHEVVVLSPADEENLSFYDFRMLGESRVLKHKPNGECIHLSDTGCAIYEHRPERGRRRCAEGAQRRPSFDAGRMGFTVALTIQGRSRPCQRCASRSAAAAPKACICKPHPLFHG
jgi:hypothetical protein